MKNKKVINIQKYNNTPINIHMKYIYNIFDENFIFFYFNYNILLNFIT